MPYTVPNFRIDFLPVASAVPRGWWRSVEYSITGFVVNSFLDEVAKAAGKDPIEFQLSLLTPGRTIVDEEAKDFPIEVDRMRRVIVGHHEDDIGRRIGGAAELDDGASGERL